ncbi:MULTISPECIES: hypothetical protein [Agrobacterium]|jgi:alpha-N-arabinofuranosidase|uniref:hypothetical protein n=1 Tax=Agrobacterium TaxID=357 RepID=UPI001FAA3B5F|nr:MULTISPECIES: hypothetical protein [Agrobacterium]MCZ7889468.1 hypothetical protein [Agrobacterium salinitolerans]UNZ54024.1 hypothetical protein MLE07_25440 [Agrobacterium tumefaciens]
MSKTTEIKTSREGARSWNRMILGHFVEHFHNQVYGGVYDPGSALADEAGFRLDVIEALKELSPPIVRWPGGNFVSDYHWYEAVGQDRTPSFNKAWRVPEPNTFGTDEFIEWCRRLGCEPYICTNAGSGTPEEMSNWLEYCNGTYETRYADMRRRARYAQPHAVKYWGIGNESYADFQIGAKTIAEWGPYVAEAAKMMRSVDCQSALNIGSDAISMTLGRSDNTCLEQIQLPASVHLSFDEFKLGDLSLSLAVRPH